MTDTDDTSILLVHQRDLASPVGSTLAYYLADELADAHTVHVICRARGKERSGDPDQDAVLYDLNTGAVPIVSAVAFHVLSTLLAALLSVRHQYTVVFCFKSCLIQGWVGSRFGRSRFGVGLQSVPVRQTENFQDVADRRGLRTRLSRTLLDHYSRVVGGLLERSSTVVCLTEGIREVTEATFGVDLADAHVVGMGVDVETFAAARDRDSARARAADDEGDWTLVYVGNVSETRGLERVLEALAATDRDVTFRIAGQGPDAYETALLERADALDVADRVEWLGLIPHEEVPALVASSDLAVSPLPDIESYRVSFPAKLVEYLAAGTVVVATDIEPHRRLIEDGENGFLYDGSPEGLATTIERALETGDRRGIERRGVETARAHDWDRIVERYEAAIFGATPPGPRTVTTQQREPATD